MMRMLNTDLTEIVSRLGEEAKHFAGKTVILTGGRGFLGRYFIDVFAALNADVLETPVRLVVLDNLITAGNYGSEAQGFDHMEFVVHDVIQPFSFDENVDYVIHAAGIASPFYYQAYPLETLEVAISGTQNMLNLAKNKGAQFTFFSSSEIYGDPDSKHMPIAESYRGNVSCQGPRACYDESKRIGETLCYIYHTRDGVKTNTIRPFNIFGPGMEENDYRVLPNFASRIKAGLPLIVYGSGRQSRTFCYITDAMVGFFLVILKGVPGEAYNIGSPKPEVSMIDLVKTLQKISKRELTYNQIEYPASYPADEPMRRCPDIRKARLQLKFNPIVRLDEGLRRFLDWSSMAFTGEP
jgi:UDP-glucuronate decarboxylase